MEKQVKLEMEPINIMEEEEEDEEEDDDDEEEDEDEECRKFSPKHCQKLQFSIAQIMGFDSSEPAPGEVVVEAEPEVLEDIERKEVKVEEEEEVEEEDGQAATKLWRPRPCAASGAALASPAVHFPADPAAMALLR